MGLISNLKQTEFRTGIAVGLVVALTALGCGGSNPTKDYGNLREKAVPAKTFTPEVKYLEVTKTVYGGTKELLPGEALVIKPHNGMFFAEGVASSYPIHARTFFKDTKFDLVAEGLPEGATLQKSATEDGVWNLSWTAPFGTVANETTKEIPLVFRIININSPKSENIDILNKINTPVSTSIMVIRKLGQPVVVKLAGLPEVVNEGDEVEFTVDVKAPGRKPENPPKLILSYDKSGVSSVDAKTGQPIPFEANGVRFVMMKAEDQKAVALNSEGVWRYKFYFIAREHDGGIGPRYKKDGKLDEKATHLYVRFNLTAASGELESEPLVAHLKIKLEGVSSSEGDLSKKSDVKKSEKNDQGKP